MARFRIRLQRNYLQMKHWNIIILNYMAINVSADALAPLVVGTSVGVAMNKVIRVNTRSTLWAVEHVIRISYMSKFSCCPTSYPSVNTDRSYQTLRLFHQVTSYAEGIVGAHRIVCRLFVFETEWCKHTQENCAIIDSDNDCRLS